MNMIEMTIIILISAVGNPVWICADLRHSKDRQWFFEHYKDQIKTVKATADQEIRMQRGWKFTPGVDDGPSECDSDNWHEWDLVVENHGKAEDLNRYLEIVHGWITKALES